MTYLSIIDKLIILINLLKESVFLLIFVGILILMLILKLLGKINNKKFMMITVLSLVGTFLVVILMNYNILSKTFDNFLDIVFTNIYFPSIYVYLFIIVSTYIITVVTILNKNITKVSRWANYSMAFILNLFLILNLSIIAKDKVDIFSTSSMYTNVNLVSMLELSMNVYILWLLVISAVYVINRITENILIKRESRLLVKEPAIINNGGLEIVDVYEDKGEENNLGVLEKDCISLVDSDTGNNGSSLVLSEVKEESEYSEPKFIDPAVIESIQCNLEKEKNVLTFNEYAMGESNLDSEVKVENVEGEELGFDMVLNQILNNSLPLQKNNKDEMFTLEDYKIFSKMLKYSIKINKCSNLKMNDILNINLLNNFSFEEYSLFKRMLNSFVN